jgi:hypothetical protein
MAAGGQQRIEQASARSAVVGRVDSSSVMVLARARRCAGPGPAGWQSRRPASGWGQQAHGTCPRILQRVKTQAARNGMLRCARRRWLSCVAQYSSMAGDQAVLDAEEGSAKKWCGAWSTRTTEHAAVVHARDLQQPDASSLRGNATAPRRRHRPRRSRSPLVHHSAPACQAAARRGRPPSRAPAWRPTGRARRACWASAAGGGSRCPIRLHPSSRSRGAGKAVGRAALEGAQFQRQLGAVGLFTDPGAAPGGPGPGAAGPGRCTGGSAAARATGA